MGKYVFKNLYNVLLIIYLLFYFYYYGLAVGLPFVVSNGWLTTFEMLFTLALFLLSILTYFINTNRCPLFISINLALFLLMIIANLFGSNDKIVSFRQFTYWILLILVFRGFFKYINKKFFLFSISLFSIIMSVFHIFYGLGVQTIQQVNAVYYLFLLFPTLLIIEENKISIIRVLAIVFLIIACILSNKGTVFLGFALFLALVVLFYFKKPKVFLGMTIIFLFVIAFFNYVLKLNIIGLFFSSFDDGGNGRTSIYISCLKLYLNSGLKKIVFGGGNFYVASMFGDGAHNEYIETLLDYGFIGLIVYLNIILYFIFKCIKLFKKEKNLFYLAFIACFMVTSLFSTLCYSYTRVLFYCLSIIYILDKERKLENENCVYSSRLSTNTSYKGWSNRNVSHSSN